MFRELQFCFYVLSSILLLVGGENAKNTFRAKRVNGIEHLGINFISMMQPICKQFIYRPLPTPFRKPVGKFFLEVSLTEDAFWKRPIKKRLHIFKGNTEFFRIGVAKPRPAKHHPVHIINNRFDHIFSNIILRIYISTMTEIGKWSEPFEFSTLNEFFLMPLLVNM